MWSLWCSHSETFLWQSRSTICIRCPRVSRIHTRGGWEVCSPKEKTLDSTSETFFPKLKAFLASFLSQCSSNLTFCYVTLKRWEQGVAFLTAAMEWSAQIAVIQFLALKASTLNKTIQKAALDHWKGCSSLCHRSKNWHPTLRDHQMTRERYHTENGVINAINDLLDHQSPSFYTTVILKLHKRWNKCVLLK